MAAKIRIGDKVIVITGKDKKKSGKVIQINRKLNKIIVEGVNIKTCHQKQNKTNKAGIFKKESFIHISNVAILYEKNKFTKIGFKIKNGKKFRIAKCSGKLLDE